MASLCTINEYRPKIAADVASEIHAIAARMDAHAEDLAADTGKMIVAENPTWMSTSISTGYRACRPAASTT